MKKEKRKKIRCMKKQTKGKGHILSACRNDKKGQEGHKT